MKKLVNGIVHFRNNNKTDYCNKFSQLAERHDPDALFIACCDSRVVPNIFASSDPGDLFVMRNIGNIIPPYHKKASDASVHTTIEFALKNLNVTDVIICGHSECGAMQAVIKQNTDNLIINTWLEHAQPAYARLMKNPSEKNSLISPCNQLSQINVLQQVNHLKTYPIIQEALAHKKIRIHGWWFDLTSADVYTYNESAESFVIIDEQQAEIILEKLS